MARSMTLNRIAWLKVGCLSTVAGLSGMSVHFAWAATFSPIPLGPPLRKPAAAIAFATLHAPEAPAFKPDALLVKPLFSPTRTPPDLAISEEKPISPVEAEPPPPPIEVPPPSYIVGGVVVAPSMRKTLLRTEQRVKGRWVSQGETTAEGWKVSSVERDAVVLERAGRSFTLPLPGRTHAR